LIKKLVIFILIGLIIATFFTYRNIEKTRPKLICNYFTEKLYRNNISNAKEYDVDEKPLIAVGPHNETMMDMTASVLKTVSKYDYDTVIILAPNHNAKAGSILISGKDWDTPVGRVNGNLGVKDKICEKIGSGIIEESQVVQEDHSASIVIPYVKEFIPNAKVVTLLFNKSVSINKVIKLGKVLKEVSDEENVLIFGSIDFAHNQDYETTVNRDKDTIRLIENFNVEELKVMNGLNIDTAEGMGCILTYLEEQGVNDINVNDERITSNLPESNSYGSYMTFVR